MLYGVVLRYASLVAGAGHAAYSRHCGHGEGRACRREAVGSARHTASGLVAGRDGPDDGERLVTGRASMTGKVRGGGSGMDQEPRDALSPQSSASVRRGVEGGG